MSEATFTFRVEEALKNEFSTDERDTLADHRLSWLRNDADSLPNTAAGVRTDIH